MSQPVIEIRGLDELIARMKQYPQQLNALSKTYMDAALIEVHSSVPPYPPPPEGSKYRRTGTLGRSMGVGFEGKPVGKPQVYESRKAGSVYEGRFGTRLNYAPHVIGEGTQKLDWWWTVKDVAEKASVGIIRIFNLMADKMAAFLERKSSG